MRVLVTGATGFVGRYLIPELVSAAYEVVICIRQVPIKPFPPKVKTYVVSDIGPDTDWTGVLDKIDAIIHLAGHAHVLDEKLKKEQTIYNRINTAGTEKLAKAAARSGVKKFIFLSTVKVMGEETKETPFSETMPPNPIGAYGKSKLAAENAMLHIAKETGLETVILRLPLLYGPGVKANMLNLLKLCYLNVPLPLAGIKNQRSLLFVGNLTDAIIKCLESKIANGQTFFVRDGEDLSTSMLIRIVTKAFKKPIRLFAVPNSLIRLFGRILGKDSTVDRLLSNLQVNDDKIRSELGWKPPFKMLQGIEVMANWYRSKRKF